MQAEDKRMLELAAKAAAFKGQWGEEGYLERRAGFIRNGWRRAWDPNRLPEDALELAATLRISVRYSMCGRFVSAGSPIDGPEEEINGAEVIATCRAIVRAAAAIGEAMP